MGAARREAVAQEAAKVAEAAEAIAAAARESAPAAPTPTRSFELSKMPVYYSYAGPGYRAHMHEGTFYWHVPGALFVWPPPLDRCKEATNQWRFDTHDDGFSSPEERKAAWLAQWPDLVIPDACALFGCSGCESRGLLPSAENIDRSDGPDGLLGSQ